MNNIVDLKGIKGIIFDMDGTLLDSLDMWSEVDRKFFGMHGMEIPEDYQSKINHMSFRENAEFSKKEYGFEESVEDIMRIWTEMSIREYEENITMKPGAKEFLMMLHQKGLPLCLATTNTRNLYEPCLKRNQVSDYFTYALTTNELHSSKTEPKIYLELAKQMNLKPSEIMVFEDILTALKTAHEAGFVTTAVYDKHSNRDFDEILRTADYYITSYETVSVL